MGIEAGTTRLQSPLSLPLFKHPFGVFLRSFTHRRRAKQREVKAFAQSFHLFSSSASKKPLSLYLSERKISPSHTLDQLLQLTLAGIHHGLAGHRPYGHRRRRKWNRPGALSVPSADLLPHLEEGVGGAVLADSVHRDAAQLHDVGAVRAPRGAPAQHARHHHQRHRHGHRAHLRRALPRLLRRHRSPPRPPPPRRRGRLRRRRRRARPHPRPHPRAPLHGRRHPLRPLRHRHVRRPALRHENGDPDKERGVHAPVPVPCLPRQRHMLDCLRPHPLRPLHHYSQRAGCAVRGGAGDPVRHLLQVDAADHRGPQAQGRPGRHDRGRRRRQERQHRQRRHRQRPLLAA